MAIRISAVSTTLLPSQSTPLLPGKSVQLGVGGVDRVALPTAEVVVQLLQRLDVIEQVEHVGERGTHENTCPTTTRSPSPTRCKTTPWNADWPDMPCQPALARAPFSSVRINSLQSQTLPL